MEHGASHSSFIENAREIELGRPQRLAAIIEEAWRRASKRRILVTLAVLTLASAAVGGYLWSSGGGPGAHRAEARSEGGGGGCDPIALRVTGDAHSMVPRNICAFSPMVEPNRIGTFSPTLAEDCADGAHPRDPLSCQLLAAEQTGLIVTGEELSNRELADVRSRVTNHRSRNVEAISASPLLDACMQKLGNGKPTFPACRWALSRRDRITEAAR